METAVEAMASMEMAPGALPHPSKMPEQRLLSLEICRWWRQSCRTSSRKTPIPLGFGLWEALNRRRGGVRGPPGGPRHPLAWPGGGRTTPGVVALWPLSSSLSVFIFHPGKIEVLAFVSSNSENISYEAFLKHKNNRKQGTGTVASCQ
jgi:hypothetical protein